ncbi:hypothetical protein [Kribbella italica]|uniref:Uncharacterized protein n=1 Tax=Kribbella italica TaxID=1540520 RepID=A0A7W9J0V0_9ACTN|nr:hypothetical protein [Kribbella italica]MBB5833576.1 hypothetical protein [Kribbella italica]
MASNLDCLGLGVPSPEAFADLIERIGPAAVLVARTDDGVELHRWEDPSGARLLLTRGKRGITRVTPSYAGERTVQLHEVRRVSDEAAVADVLADGETATRLAIELEELPVLGDATHEGLASVVALAPDAEFFADAATFATADASLLGDGDAGPRPAHYEADWIWPPRLDAESFIPTGLFGADNETEPLALLNGTIRYAERRTTMLTGQDFVVARAHTAAFEADICLPADHPVPLPGTVISTNAFLTGSLEADLPTPRRRWFSRG